MLAKLRKPLFLIALALIFVVLLIEIGSGLVEFFEAGRPGMGIYYLVLLDVLLVFTIALMACSLLIPERVQGRIQGIATLVVSILVLLAAITKVFTALGKLVLMVSLLLAPIFGTIAYFGAYGHFDRAPATVTLSLLMTLKLFFAGFLVFAHQRFLENKGLVLMILTSLVANIIISFLHGFVPGFLVSITDSVAAIIIAILAIIWAIVFLIGSIISIVKAIV